MSLRLRLIVAFFLLSVVPLAAVTLYTYASNAAAVREAAGLEAESLAGDLTERMQLVTAQISERVEHLMDVQREADTAARRPAGAPGGSAPAAPETHSTASEPMADNRAPSADDTVAEALGEVAMLLNNIEVRGLRPPGGGGGRGPGPPDAPPSPPWTPPLPGGIATAGRGGERGFRGGERGRRGDVIMGQPVPLPSPIVPGVPVPPGDQAFSEPRIGVPVESSPEMRPGRRVGGEPERAGAPADRIVRGAFPDGTSGRSGGAAPVPAEGAAPPGDGAEQDRIMFDMMPIRREMLQQMVGSSEEFQRLSPDERQRVIAEVNQRMLGIAQGIQMGAAEVQKKVSEAQRLADEKQRAEASRRAAAVRKRAAAAATPAARAARAARPGTVTGGDATAASDPVGTSGPTRRRTALSGSRLDVTVERNGKVLRAANAEVNLPNLLATVFTTTRRDRGEVPFAFSKDGRLFTQTDEDRAKVESLGGGAVKPEGPLGTMVLPDWIVVTTADPAGSGLRFGIARPVGESLNELRRAGARSAALGLGCIGLALVGIVPLSSRLTRNLSTLNDGVHRIAQGDYGARVQVGSNDEIGKLARAFNQMAEDVERHQHAVVEQERIRRELELGRQIQNDMLPQGPLRVGLTEIKGVSVPAREVGGDFFNYFQLADGELALLVGDVSGKGVGAALLMANIQASLRTRLALGQDLASIAREIDVDIEGNTPGAVYATLFVGMLSPSTRVLRYVNAGHNPQYVLRRDGTLEKMSSSGLPVGLIAGHGYSEDRVQLHPGDLVFFYTDGCVEEENEAGEMFGAERLEALLRSSAGAEDLLANVETAVKTFRGTAEAYDDATMMVVKVG